jgi:hypothetical protein
MSGRRGCLWIEMSRRADNVLLLLVMPSPAVLAVCYLQRTAWRAVVSCMQRQQVSDQLLLQV